MVADSYVYQTHQPTLCSFTSTVNHVIAGMSLQVDKSVGAGLAWV